MCGTCCGFVLVLARVLPWRAASSLRDGRPCTPRKRCDTPASTLSLVQVGATAQMLSKASEEESQRLAQLAKMSRRAMMAPGAVATLGETGYQEVAQVRSNVQMEMYVRRVIHAHGGFINSEGDLLGVVPFYSGEKAVQSYDALMKELARATWLSGFSAGAPRWPRGLGASERLRQRGYEKLVRLHDFREMKMYLQRVILLLCGRVGDAEGLREATSAHIRTDIDNTFANLITDLVGASWIHDLAGTDESYEAGYNILKDEAATGNVDMKKFARKYVAATGRRVSSEDNFTAFTSSLTNKTSDWGFKTFSEALGNATFIEEDNSVGAQVVSDGAAAATESPLSMVEDLAQLPIRSSEISGGIDAENVFAASFEDGEVAGGGGEAAYKKDPLPADEAAKSFELDRAGNAAADIFAASFEEEVPEPLSHSESSHAENDNSELNLGADTESGVISALKTSAPVAASEPALAGDPPLLRDPLLLSSKSPLPLPTLSPEAPSIGIRADGLERTEQNSQVPELSVHSADEVGRAESGDSIQSFGAGAASEKLSSHADTNDAAAAASDKVDSSLSPTSSLAVEPSAQAMDTEEQNYQAVLAKRNNGLMGAFIRKLLAARRWKIVDSKAFVEMVRTFSGRIAVHSFAELKAALQTAPCLQRPPGAVFDAKHREVSWLQRGPPVRVAASSLSVSRMEVYHMRERQAEEEAEAQARAAAEVAAALMRR
eukprot:TRINITY_DN4786_c0_g1_i2.p1 TRINITY_DN4786_c0_g1~~TRINITY_DN4786_c0_g1_i2.p1  ORF type:complete len:718 (+),score=169.05 TRINITY_DN4786_c0_g1_i2:1570-3723(+)